MTNQSNALFNISRQYISGKSAFYFLWVFFFLLFSFPFFLMFIGLDQLLCTSCHRTNTATRRCHNFATFLCQGRPKVQIPQRKHIDRRCHNTSEVWTSFPFRCNSLDKTKPRCRRPWWCHCRRGHWLAGDAVEPGGQFSGSRWWWGGGRYSPANWSPHM